MKRVLLGALLSVLLFYLYVLGVTLIPDVSDEYRDYYITRQSGLSPRERERMETVFPGETLLFDTTKIGFDSWSAAEAGFRWSLGASPQLHFLLETGQEAAEIVALELELRPMGRQRVRVVLNDQALEDHELTEAETLRISVPDTLLRAGENTLRLELPDARRPGNGDPRELGLALVSLSLSRA
ncbi:MAG: hypothetical protein KDI28_04230 [Pseudomonadales bacterium]|nr:hypothetical protein [Pseudomonadales bacterium]MCP5356800.1 hypothetical protein [Pseudomonadales bacterium]